ncbi:S8 family peptidase [bacterium]|nr:S8 family peptidase [bacterium]
MCFRVSLFAVLSALLQLPILTSIAIPNTIFTSGIEEVLRTESPEEYVRIVICFNNRINPDELADEVAGLNKIEKREYLIDRLQENLEFQAQNTISWAKNEALTGNIRFYRELWILNALVCEIKVSRIRLLENFSEIQKVRYDYPILFEELFDTKSDEREYVPIETDRLEWGVEDIGAPALWEEGFYGRNAIVGFMDTGCNVNHQDLRDHIWINTAEIPNNGIDDDNNSYIDDFYGYNFYDDSPDIVDGNGHGTKVAGVLAGDGTGGDTTGVAPQARLMVLRIYGEDSSESRNWEAEQYAIANGADVISNSLSYKWQGLDDYPAYLEHRYVHEIALIFGMIQSNSTGNSGNDLDDQPIPWNISAPANNPPPWLHAEQTLIGGLTDVLGCGAYSSNGEIYAYSDYGPASWDREDFVDPERNIDYHDYPWEDGDAELIGLLKPDVVAPQGVLSTRRTGGYTNFSATSSAAPHLGGALTILRSIHQQATPAQITEAIKMSAEDAGAPGHDNRWGAGKLRVYDAHLYLEEMFSDLYGALEISFINDDDENVAGNFEVLLDSGVVKGYADDNDTAYLPKIVELNYNIIVFQDNEFIDDFGSFEIRAGDTTMLRLNVESGNEVFDQSVAIPEEYVVLTSYPNPFNSETTISYSLPSDSRVSLKIYDISGREVANLVNSGKSAGTNSIMWQAQDFPSGLYFVVIQTRHGQAINKIMLLK